MQEKYDTAFSEQQGLEADLEAANDLIDRLRANVAESEKHNRNGARRYADQVGGESRLHRVSQSTLTLAGEGVRG